MAACTPDALAAWCALNSHPRAQVRLYFAEARPREVHEVRVLLLRRNGASLTPGNSVPENSPEALVRGWRRDEESSTDTIVVSAAIAGNIPAADYTVQVRRGACHARTCLCRCYSSRVKDLSNN